MGLVGALMFARVAIAAPFTLSDFETYESRSGQFVVTGVRPVAYLGLGDTLRPATNYVQLETGVVVIGCERVKSALLNVLGMPDKWRGKIHVRLRPESAADTAILVTRERFSDGWKFQLVAPHYVEPVKFIRATVWVLLMEMINRDDTLTTATDVPLWLVEGLATHLVAQDASGLLLRPRTAIVVNELRPDSFRDTREVFKQQTPLSFADLSLPARSQLEGAAWESYRASAQLFLASLLELSDGRACLVELLQQLPRFLNGQFAFLQAFRGHFSSMLEVEKWWSLNVVNFTGRDQHLRWSSAISLQRLNELLSVTVETRAAANALPQRQEVTLQRMLQETEFNAQRPALANLERQLQALQWNAPPDLSRLVEDYRKALSGYLQKRDKAVGVQAGKLVLQELLKQLDMLDVIREDFRKYDLAEVKPPVAK